MQIKGKNAHACAWEQKDRQHLGVLDKAMSKKHVGKGVGHFETQTFKGILDGGESGRPWGVG